jgi:hypothetical protein
MKMKVSPGQKKLCMCVDALGLEWIDRQAGGLQADEPRL